MLGKITFQLAHSEDERRLPRIAVMVMLTFRDHDQYFLGTANRLGKCNDDLLNLKGDCNPGDLYVLYERAL